jgi:hypothetical protein
LRRVPATVPLPYFAEPVFQQRSTDERAARRSLRVQIARLERASSRVVAERFPYIAAPAGANMRGHCPHLLSFAELERLRDCLVGQVHELHHQAAEHVEHVRCSRELLEQMQLEPGRHKFMRLPVTNLGQGGCGAWEVRPRLGLIGMLAGWWHVKLSSGCPLPKGRATARPADSSSSSWIVRLCTRQPVPFAGNDRSVGARLAFSGLNRPKEQTCPNPRSCEICHST